MLLQQSIIIVDDDPGMGRAIQRVLGAAGWNAEVFLSGEALLESDSVPEAAAFILDLSLPGLSGFELGSLLASEGVRAPFIFVTAYDRPIARAKADRLGAAGFFIKPFSARALINTLSSVLSSRS